jgi:hypothetical protein
VTEVQAKLEALRARALESAEAARAGDPLGAVLLEEAEEEYRKAIAAAAAARTKFLTYLTRPRGARRAGHGG